MAQGLAAGVMVLMLMTITPTTVCAIKPGSGSASQGLKMAETEPEIPSDISYLAIGVRLIGDSLLYVVSSFFIWIESIVNATCDSLVWTVNFLFGIIDLILRGPFIMIKWCLQFIVLVIDGILYLTKDLKFLSIEDVISFFIRSVTWSLVTTLELCRIILVSIIGAIHSTVMLYIQIVDNVVYNAVFPVLDGVYWIGAVIGVTALILFLIRMLSLSNTFNAFQNKVLFVGLAASAYVIVFFSKYICSILLTYVIHPIVYCIIIMLTSYCLYVTAIVHFIQTFRSFLPYLLLIKSRANDFIRPYISMIIAKYTKVKRLLRNKTLVAEFPAQYNGECIVCFEEEMPMVLLDPCAHNTICKTCIIRIIRQNNRCPLCRSVIHGFTEILESVL